MFPQLCKFNGMRHRFRKMNTAGLVVTSGHSLVVRALAADGRRSGFDSQGLPAFHFPPHMFEYVFILYCRL